MLIALKRILLLALLILTFGGTANAAHSRYHDQHWSHGSVHRHILLAHRGVHRGYQDGRPSAWCGWQMRQWFGGGSEYNLAAQWAHRGSSVRPEEFRGGGVIVVVWPHHVGYITSKLDKPYKDRHGNLVEYTVKSGNDGHTIKDRPRTLAGAIAIRKL